MPDEFRRSTYAIMVENDGNRKYSDLSQTLDLIGSLDEARSMIRLFGYLTDIYHIQMRQLAYIDESRSVNSAGIVTPTPNKQMAYVYSPKINEIQTWRDGRLVHLWWAGTHYSNRVTNLVALTGSVPPPDVCVSVSETDQGHLGLLYAPNLLYV